MKDMKEIPLKPKVKEALAYLKDKGIRLAVATATRRDRTEDYLGRTGLIDYFDELISAREVANGKPAPDVYLYACEMLGIPHRNIVAMQGPFTVELNVATIRQYGGRYVVTKDGGGPGGFPEKAQAARETGAQLIVLRRPADSGLPFCEVLNLCKTRIRAANIGKQGETK